MGEATRSADSGDPAKSRRKSGQNTAAVAERDAVEVTSSEIRGVPGPTESRNRPGEDAGQSATTTSGSQSQRGFVDRIRDRAGDQLSTQKDRATDGIGTIAQAVRTATRELRGDKHDTLAEYVERAADQLERLSAGLKERNVGELLREAQNLARRRPVLFVGSAFALGLLGARFLKSTPPGHRRAQPLWQQTGERSSSSAAISGMTPRRDLDEESV
jgi:hypothetical protein